MFSAFRVLAAGVDCIGKKQQQLNLMNSDHLAGDWFIFSLRLELDPYELDVLMELIYHLYLWNSHS